MPIDDNRRADPDLLLKQLEDQERQATRGKLKVFLGYASGVGKSFQMLDEGRRRRERNGEDVVVGIVQNRYSPEVEQVLSHLEVIPAYKSESMDAIDVGAILRRKPQVVLIDGLAYDNPSDCRNAKRWQDVLELLASGISVIGTINLQYIEELQDEITAITGKRHYHTVPKAFFEQADEVAIVDVPPEESLRRGGSGLQLTPGEQRNLSRLRELALLVAAEAVDRQLERYLKAHGIEESLGTQERIMVCITPRSNAAKMIASGRRNADRFHGELFVVYVQQPNLSAEDRISLERKKEIAAQYNAQVKVLVEKNFVHAIVEYARQKGITQIFIGHSMQRGWLRRFLGDRVDTLIRSAAGMDVIVFPH
jgi:two-component system, OmpR family, sensor histidine kinase KdpD